MKMNKALPLFFLLLVSLVNVVFAHENFPVEGFNQEGRSLVVAFGRFHFLFLHFPIALVVMTVVAEVLSVWSDNKMFEHAATFMIMAAAAFVIPTTLFGWMLSYEGIFVEPQITYFYWHRLFGFLTCFFALLTAYFKVFHFEKGKTYALYYFSLCILFLLISITGTFGGALAFGIDSW